MDFIIMKFPIKQPSSQREKVEVIINYIHQKGFLCGIGEGIKYLIFS